MVVNTDFLSCHCSREERVRPSLRRLATRASNSSMANGFCTILARAGEGIPLRIVKERITAARESRVLIQCASQSIPVWILVCRAQDQDELLGRRSDAGTPGEHGQG